jgi:hypothetical protein
VFGVISQVDLTRLALVHDCPPQIIRAQLAPYQPFIIEIPRRLAKTRFEAASMNIVKIKLTR